MQYDLKYEIPKLTTLSLLLSRHGAALKKNISNLSRRVSSENYKKSEALELEETNGRLGTIARPPPFKSRKFSEAVDIEAVMSFSSDRGTAGENKNTEETSGYQIIRAKSTNLSLKWISVTYAWGQLLVAFVGGFAIIPAGKICCLFHVGYHTNEVSLTVWLEFIVCQYLKHLQCVLLPPCIR